MLRTEWEQKMKDDNSLVTEDNWGCGQCLTPALTAGHGVIFPALDKKGAIVQLDLISAEFMCLTSFVLQHFVVYDMQNKVDYSM